MGEPVNLEPLVQADEGTLQALRAAYWKRVRQSGVDVTGKLFIDKHPLNTLNLPLIARLFPRAKILFIVPRSARRGAQLLSAPLQYESGDVPDADLGGRGAVLRCRHGLLPSSHGRCWVCPWHEVRYEHLMADFAGQMRAICQFLGIEWIDDMQTFASRVQSRERATPSTAQLARGLDRSGIGHWQHYRAVLEPVQPVLARWVERFGAPVADD